VACLDGDGGVGEEGAVFSVKEFEDIWKQAEWKWKEALCTLRPKMVIRIYRANWEDKALLYTVATTVPMIIGGCFSFSAGY
jgi:hypothetical protein